MRYSGFIAAALALLLTAVPLSAATQLQGEKTQGALLLGKTEPGSRVFFNQQPIRVSSRGDFIIGFNRDEPPTAQLEIRSAKGEVEKQTLHITKRHYRTQRINGLPPKKVTPDPSVLKRIRKENAKVGQARKRDDDRSDFLGGFIWPLQGPITGVYGSQRILNGKPRRPHYGIDFAAPVGTPVKAPAAGIVTLAEKDLFYSGGTLILDHGHGLSSSFLHLSKLLVKVGERVEKGQIIAEVGSTGRATGAHLDWRMNWFKRRLDPQFVMQPRPDIADPKP
ncbi:MAG: M23 family metallopeptidase [gamma proteobacterium symbiont of Bathyaustriella thionipta]|nr:M23 family metallopeptidase [gamma proteobacterium symbiont of Bathyaustriella thionipta]